MDIIKDKIEGSAGFKRVEMPQIDFDDLELALASLLSKGVGIKVKQIPGKRIKFAQNEIDDTKVQNKIDAKSKQFKDRVYFVSRGWYVVDGHHDLAQCLKVAPRTKLTCFVCDINIYELVQLLNSFKFTDNEDIQKALRAKKLIDKKGHWTTRYVKDKSYFEFDSSNAIKELGLNLPSRKIFTDGNVLVDDSGIRVRYLEELPFYKERLSAEQIQKLKIKRQFNESGSLISANKFLRGVTQNERNKKSAEDLLKVIPKMSKVSKSFRFSSIDLSKFKVGDVFVEQGLMSASSIDFDEEQLKSFVGDRVMHQKMVIESDAYELGKYYIASPEFLEERKYEVALLPGKFEITLIDNDVYHIKRKQ